MAGLIQNVSRKRTSNARRVITREMSMAKTPREAPEQIIPPLPFSGTMTSRAFWQMVDRLQIPDADALELIDYPGRIGASGKRPRFRLSTRQTRLAAYLPEIETALYKIGETPAWLQRRNRAAPFSGRTPLQWMMEQEGAGLAGVLQFLNRLVLRHSLR